MELVTCMTVDQMAGFLNLTGLEYTIRGAFLIVHATAADAFWVITGDQFCIGAGERV